MAEKTAPQQAEHGENDIENVGHSGPGSSIAEMAMRHAVGQAATDQDMAHTEPPTESTTRLVEQIVVDLRSVEGAEDLEATVELHSVREVPAGLDFEALESVVLPRSNNDGMQLEIDLRDPASLSANETHTQPTQTEPVLPMPRSGLAVASRTERAAKRAMDISIATAAFLILTPLLILIAILVKTTSRGPVLYRSKRIGEGGAEFTFLKFRSMYDGAAGDRSNLATRNEKTGPIFKMKDDPRITPLGRWLRKASIDELPQLVHVLSGKMSLVGPRPALPDEVAQYDVRASQRLTVKPGITCTWQVSGRSELDFDTWVDMDVDYIRHWTLLADLRLLVLTIPAVLSGRGAY